MGPTREAGFIGGETSLFKRPEMRLGKAASPG